MFFELFLAYLLVFDLAVFLPSRWCSRKWRLGEVTASFILVFTPQGKESKESITLTDTVIQTLPYYCLP